jgi:hypothetical protein
VTVVADPRMRDTRISAALRHASERGATDKHKLMLRAADAIEEIELVMAAIDQDMARGHHDVVKLRLKHIARVLGHGNTESNGACIEGYQHNTKQNTSTNGN